MTQLLPEADRMSQLTPLAETGLKALELVRGADGRREKLATNIDLFRRLAAEKSGS